jgi:hypothetical protein
MGQSFFDTLGTRERQLAQDRTDALTAMLVRWAQRYPTVRTAWIPSVALLTSTVAPQISPIDTLVSAKLVFWIFGVDDMADEGTISPQELQKRTEDWYWIASGDVIRGTDQGDGLGRMLMEIKRELSMYPLFESLHERWADELTRFMDRKVQECRMARAFAVNGASALPSVEEYVEWGLHGVGVPLWSWAVWAVVDDPSVKEYLAPIVKATEHTAAAVRLYNDLRTYQRELDEESVNSVLIACHAMLDEDPDQPVELVVTEAKRRVMQLAVSHSHRCRDILQDVHTDSGMPEKVLLRTVAFSHYFYAQGGHDYHFASTRGVNKLLGQRVS